ncbi:Arm DNA-binding domain-containing protein [Flavobacterium ovatum]|uniref:Arm DNA-binding domain-containing protein n=1 Tax=Flavobacterium ovatum TaxID=1928857 RepID=UPI00344B080C
MNTTVSVLFYIKRSKINNDGICPIYTRVTIQAKRFEFSTNKYINPERWSGEGSKVKGTNEEARYPPEQLHVVLYDAIIHRSVMLQWCRFR